jgi:uncharacterized protein (DUF4415 family)
MAKDGDIRRYSATELREKREREGSKTDQAFVLATTEEEIERQIAADPDFRDIPADWYEQAVLSSPLPKRLLSLRLDADVVDWFKQQGSGYQTRMNAVLKAYVDQKKRA